jgi:hypothetical protein
MSKKKDTSIRSGFAKGGAADIQFETVGRGYRRATMVIDGLGTCTVFKIPTSSHLDDRALERKARDYARRFVKYNVTTLTW